MHHMYSLHACLCDQRAPSLATWHCKAATVHAAVVNSDTITVLFRNAACRWPVKPLFTSAHAAKDHKDGCWANAYFDWSQFVLPAM